MTNPDKFARHGGEGLSHLCARWRPIWPTQYSMHRHMPRHNVRDYIIKALCSPRAHTVSMHAVMYSFAAMPADKPAPCEVAWDIICFPAAATGSAKAAAMSITPRSQQLAVSNTTVPTSSRPPKQLAVAIGIGIGPGWKENRERDAPAGQTSSEVVFGQ